MTISVAIVGAGIVGRLHTEAMLRHPGLRITAVVDPLRQAREELATQTAATPYETLTDAMDGVDSVDMVAICTPSGLHASVTEEALAAGKHVVIEKPLDSSLPRARRLAQLAQEAERRGQVCSVISQHRFDPASVAVAEAVAGGRFGRITSAVASVAWWRSQNYYDSAQWRGTWEFDGGGAVMNQGIHTVDLLVWLLGRPVEIFAHTGLLAHQRIEVEDVAVATVRFASGALATMHATTAAYPGLTVRLQVHGSRGSAIIDSDQLAYFHSAADSNEDDPKRPANQAADVVPASELYGAAKPVDCFILGHLRQYQDIVEAVEQGRAPGVGVADAFTAMAMVKAIYLSAAKAAPVAFDEVLSGALDDA